jgi:hypothetical protein
MKLARTIRFSGGRHIAEFSDSVQRRCVGAPWTLAFSVGFIDNNGITEPGPTHPNIAHDRIHTCLVAEIDRPYDEGVRSLRLLVASDGSYGGPDWNEYLRA